MKTRLALILFVLATTSATAGQSADGVLLPGDKVRDVLAPTGETKTVAVAAVEGSLLSVIAKATKGSSVTPVLSLMAPDGSTMDLAAFTKGSGKKVQIKKLPVTLTGIYRLSVHTPTGAGGQFEISTKLKLPKAPRITSQTVDGAQPATFDFPALPGAVATIKVSSKGKPSWTPAVELSAPSGLPLAAGPAKATSLKKIVLPQLGDYRVAVTGGPGGFKATVKLKFASKRRLAFTDVEALPAVSSYTPAAVDNDAVIGFRFNGFGFTPEHTIQILDGASAVVNATVGTIFPDRVEMDIDLGGIAPGTYSVAVGSPTGRSRVLETPLVLGNRAPEVDRITPSGVPNVGGTVFHVRGRGFDTGSTVTLMRTEGAHPMHISSVVRVDHTDLEITADPEVFRTGLHDLRVDEPSGSHTTREDFVDVVGYSAKPSLMWTYNGSDAGSWALPYHTAYNTTRDTMVVSAFAGQGNVAWHLRDAETLASLGAVVFDSAQSEFYNPRVAYSAVDDTFALLYLEYISSSRTKAHLRIVAGDDMDRVLYAATVGDARSILQLDAAARPVVGGYLLTWDEWDGTTNRILIQPFDTDGPVNATPRVADADTEYFMGEPVVSHYRDDTYVVAYLGTNEEDFARRATRRVVVTGSGVLFREPQMVATGIWFDFFGIELARNPVDGEILLGFTWDDGTGLRHAAYSMLEGIGAVSVNRDSLSLDFDVSEPAGALHSVAWSPDRGEYLVTMAVVGGRTAVRRVAADGVPVPAGKIEAYEARTLTAAAGTAPGSVFMFHAGDRDEDGQFDPSTQVIDFYLAPYR